MRPFGVTLASFSSNLREEKCAKYISTFWVQLWSHVGSMLGTFGVTLDLCWSNFREEKGAEHIGTFLVPF